MKITICNFEESKHAICTVRETVFEKEQGVPRELERDGQDLECIHVVAYDEQDKQIGTGRLQLNGKIGRMAVLKEWRGQGVGGKMLKALIDAAINQRITKIYLFAQKDAIQFYKSHGFNIVGPEFMEANIPHLKMTKKNRTIP